MEINYLGSYKVVASWILPSLALGIFVIGGSEVRADAYAECNQILVQDVFNRTTNFQSKSAAEKASAYASIFQMSDHEAYKEYSKQHDEAKSRTEAGEGGGSFLGIIEAEGGGSVDNKHKLTESEFSKRFNKAKDEYKKETGSATSSNENLVSNYASYTRDPGTVAAWKECVTKSKDTNLYAYASRDNAGEIYVNVIWVPGVLAGSLPSIPVKFVTDGDADGVKIHAEPDEQIAMGSGQSFAVSCGAKCDNGFQVTVNGVLKNAAGVKTNSFTSMVEVPPLTPPILKTSMVGNWSGSPDCIIVIYKDDGNEIEGNCDTNKIKHSLKGNYAAPDNIALLITRTDEKSCVTDTKGFIKIINNNRASFGSYGWNGCGVTTASGTQTWSRKD